MLLVACRPPWRGSASLSVHKVETRDGLVQTPPCWCCLGGRNKTIAAVLTVELPTIVSTCPIPVQGGVR
uniref:Uncharacterized protein n=1 Tax=Zea mays TaxID=4577 RepID=A0A804NCC2_MAIZE